MRHIEFSKQFTEQFGKVVVVVDVRQEFGVCLVEVIPVGAVHISTEEALFLLVVDVTEHILALFGRIKLHVSGNRH